MQIRNSMSHQHTMKFTGGLVLLISSCLLLTACTTGSQNRSISTESNANNQSAKNKPSTVTSTETNPLPLNSNRRRLSAEEVLTDIAGKCLLTPGYEQLCFVIYPNSTYQIFDDGLERGPAMDGYFDGDMHCTIGKNNKKSCASFFRENGKLFSINGNDINSKKKAYPHALISKEQYLANYKTPIIAAEKSKPLANNTRAPSANTSSSTKAHSISSENIPVKAFGAIASASKDYAQLVAREHERRCDLVVDQIGRLFESSFDSLQGMNGNPSNDCKRFKSADNIMAQIEKKIRMADALPQCGSERTGVSVDQINTLRSTTIQTGLQVNCDGNISALSSENSGLPSFFVDTQRKIEESTRRIEKLLAEEKQKAQVEKDVLVQNNNVSNNRGSNSTIDAVDPSGCFTFVFDEHGSLLAENNCSFPVSYSYCLVGMPSYSSQFECDGGKYLKHRSVQSYNKAGSGLGLKPGKRSLSVTSVNTGRNKIRVIWAACGTGPSGKSPYAVLTGLNPPQSKCF